MFMINNNRYNVGFASGNAGRIDAGYNSVSTSLSNDPLLEWRWVENGDKDIRDYGFSYIFENNYGASGAKYNIYFSTRIGCSASYRSEINMTLTCPDNFYFTYLKTYAKGKEADVAYHGCVKVKPSYSRTTTELYGVDQEFYLDKPSKLDKLIIEACHRNEGFDAPHYAYIKEIRGIFM